MCVGPAAATASYLNQDAILQAAEQEDCQAVHPGYGFLAENASFAARCEQQGITFVGPPPAAIRCMGDKALAKRTMAEGGLPTIPGSEGVLAGFDVQQVPAAVVVAGLTDHLTVEPDLGALRTHVGLDGSREIGDAHRYMETNANVGKILIDLR